MSSGNVKHAIALLCNIAHSTCIYFELSLVPEDFRAAKFDKPCDERRWWLNLAYLLGFIELSPSHISSYPTNNLVLFVRRFLLTLGYKDDALVVPRESDDGTLQTGSRDLLLAFAWLMVKVDFDACVRRWCELQVESVTEQALSSVVNFPLESDHGKTSTRGGSSCRSLDELVQVVGRFRSDLRCLLAAEEEKGRLTTRLLSSLKSDGIGRQSPSTVTEVCLLFARDRLPAVCSALESVNTILAQLAEWQQRQTVFWQWMESVLDEKKKDICASSLRAWWLDFGCCKRKVLAQCWRARLQVADRMLQEIEKPRFRPLSLTSAAGSRGKHETLSNVYRSQLEKSLSLVSEEPVDSYWHGLLEVLQKRPELIPLVTRGMRKT